MLAHVNDREPSLVQYLTQIDNFPLLTREQEYQLAVKYKKDNDIEAAHTLVTSNLRFVVKIANRYHRYGYKLLDLIQEGNVGLMIAVKKYKPSMDTKLITYAVWWIKAKIREYIMANWSLIKMGTTQNQRKLFFKVKSLVTKYKQKGIDNIENEIAKELDIPIEEVLDFTNRINSRDTTFISSEDEDINGLTIESLDSGELSQEELLIHLENENIKNQKVKEALGILNDRERFIIYSRILKENPLTYQEIGDILQISKQRVKQLETNCLKKMKGCSI